MDAQRASGSGEAAERIASSVARLREDLAGTTGGSSPDPVVRARLVEGLRVESTDPHGHTIETDMPEAVGGEASGMSPGSAMRAAVASCDATAIAIEAASRGIVISELEVEVTSRSDQRGMIGLAGVAPQPSGFEVRIRLASAQADEGELRSLVEHALRHSPVGKALEHAAAVEVSLELRTSSG